MLRKVVLWVVVFILSTPSVLHAQQPKDKLVIAISSGFQPFTFLNVDGKPTGMFVDIWRLWAQKTGRQIEFISSNWITSLDNLKNKKADIHSALLYSPERFKWMSGSQPFHEVGIGLFYTGKQGKISDMKELSGQTVAVLAGGHQERYLKNNYPDIRVIVCDTREELVRVSIEGKARGFIAILPVGTDVIARMGVSGEFETFDRTFYRENVHAGVLKENTEMLALVNRGFDAISQNELAEIEARWMPDPTKRYYKTSNMIPLTPAEEAWIKNHKTIRVGMSPIFPPLKFSEKDVIKGIEPDYLSLLSEYTGIRFEYVIAGFPVMDAKVKAGEMDMFISFNIPERLAYMTFTEPFMDFKQLIVTRSDAPFMSGISSLKGKKVATTRGVKLHDKILSPYPEIEKVPVNTMGEMFKAVSESRADALIAQSFLVGYVMQDYPNLKIAGVVDIPQDPYLYAVRKDYPELVGILNKAIKAIPKDRLDAIIQKWSRVRVEYQPNWREIMIWASVVGGAFASILGMTLFWNRRLAKEVDIRKQAEVALRKSEENYRYIFENAPVGIFHSLPEGRFLQVNQSLSHMLGYGTPEEMTTVITNIGTQIYVDSKKRSDILSITMNSADWVYAENRYRCKDGAIITANLNVRKILDADGAVAYLEGFVEDITERKRMEEEKKFMEERLQRSEKMESLGTLAGGVAHDLNNVLGVVVGYSELLLEEIGDASPLRNDVIKIMEGGHRSAAIVQDLLTLARRGVQTRKVVNLNDAISDCQKTPEFEKVLSYNPKVRINTDLEADLLNIMGSPVHICKSIMNLLSNAVEAMPDGGSLTITTRNQSLDSPVQGYDTVNAGDYVLLLVTDTGEGISDGDMKRIFEPFYTKKNMGRSGTGLGLAVVWGTVKDHAGYIDIQSEVGKGTIFTLYFPVTREEVAKPAIAISLSEYIGHDESILVVDDIKEQRELAARMLGRLNYKVTTVASGEEAAEYLRTNKVDLIVLDMIMDPGMDGLDTYKAILEIHPDQKAIVVSGFSESDRVKEVQSLGAGPYIKKPYVLERLGIAVREELDKNERLTPRGAVNSG